MRKYGLIGYPLGHSYSKKYFTEKFSREGLNDCSYELYPLKDIDELPLLLRNDMDLRGLNVTIPHKSAVFKFLDFISDEALEIGAINVIKVRRTGNDIKLSGFNSDVTGFTLSLKPFLSDQKNALVLGTGGSSRAVVYALQKLGLKVSIVSRQPGPGVITYPQISRELLGKTDIIVNTTPVGMYPDVDSKPDISYEHLTGRHILYDLVYNPELTSFLRLGKQRGCTTISGLEMLGIQAERAWEIWNDDDL